MSALLFVWWTKYVTFCKYFWHWLKNLFQGSSSDFKVSAGCKAFRKKPWRCMFESDMIPILWLWAHLGWYVKQYMEVNGFENVCVWQKNDALSTGQSRQICISFFSNSVNWILYIIEILHPHCPQLVPIIVWSQNTHPGRLVTLINRMEVAYNMTLKRISPWQ